MRTEPETVYVKRGRRYEAVGVNEVPIIVKPGWHLVHVTDGCRTTHFNINPDDACRRAGREMLVADLIPLLRDALDAGEPLSLNDIAVRVAEALEAGGKP